MPAVDFLTAMTADNAKKLRAPFKPEQIGKLPKPTKKENPKGRCSECGGYHGMPAVHLDYVGHAAVTDRLLEVDPAWTWEPMAYGGNGEPLMTNGGLWIWLTVCGVKRPGFGDATTGGATKEIIGDAIRNAAMRFGVALDLWSKEDLTGSDESAQGNAEPTAGEAAKPKTSTRAASPANGNERDPKFATVKQTGRLWAIAQENGVDEETLREIIVKHTGQPSGAEIPKDRYDPIVLAVQTHKLATALATGTADDIPF